MSVDTFKLLAEGLKSNTKLTELFFTHNDIRGGEEGGEQFILSLGNKKDLKSLALNSCNLNGSLLELLMNSIKE
jgi:hypothetical protein